MNSNDGAGRTSGCANCDLTEPGTPRPEFEGVTIPRVSQNVGHRDEQQEHDQLKRAAPAAQCT